jgi:hypothetical protein
MHVLRASLAAAAASLTAARRNAALPVRDAPRTASRTVVLKRSADMTDCYDKILGGRVRLVFADERCCVDDQPATLPCFGRRSRSKPSVLARTHDASANDLAR